MNKFLLLRKGDTMKGQFLTDRGQIRSHNEDSGGFFHNPFNQYLAIIADGMGGHQAGDIASQVATSIIREKWQESNNFNVPEEAEAWLKEKVLEINKSIYDQSNQNEAYQGMGTTVVISICTDDFITIAHIGDSRCYMLNENGFKQMTEDHSLVNELIRSGEISVEDAEYHPRKNVLLRALGTEEQVVSDVQSISWEIGDKLLLCSDGLTNKLADDELGELLHSDYSIEETGQKMVDLANERGGEDNISLVIVEHTASGKEGEASC